MRTYTCRSIEALALAGVLGAIATGCAQGPARRYVQLSDAHVAVTEEVTLLSRAGVLTVKQVEVAYEVLKLADQRLDEYREALARGDEYDALGPLLRTIADLIESAARIIEEKGDP